MRKLLVTGGCGFIGSHFVAMAERNGHRCLVLDRLTYAGRQANLPPGDRVYALGGDICSGPLVRDLFTSFEPDAVVHLAAETHVTRSIDSRAEFLRTNVHGTNTLLEEALRYWEGRGRPAEFRFVHVSTDEVYGSLGAHDAPWTEASPYAPNNPYAASKAASDHMVRSYFRTFGLPAVVTHCSNNYGPRQHPEKLIPTLVRQVMAGEPMTIHGNGQNVRDWLHVDDHCEGLLDALQLGEPGETYNFGGSCELTNLQVARLVHSLMAPCTPPNIVHVTDRPGNDLRYATNTTKAWTDLGWKPGASISARLADTIRWYLQNPNYADDYGR